MAEKTRPFFVPQIYIPGGITDISFYAKAFGAEELRRWCNDDGSIHAAELAINGALFIIHEASSAKKLLSPEACGGTTVIIGLMTDDVDAIMSSALAAGAAEISPAQDYDYGYRQGEIKDPFGHIWTIEKKI